MSTQHGKKKKPRMYPVNCTIHIHVGEQVITDDFQKYFEDNQAPMEIRPLETHINHFGLYAFLNFDTPLHAESCLLWLRTHPVDWLGSASLKSNPLPPNKIIKARLDGPNGHRASPKKKKTKKTSTPAHRNSATSSATSTVTATPAPTPSAEPSPSTARARPQTATPAAPAAAPAQATPTQQAAADPSGYMQRMLLMQRQMQQLSMSGAVTQPQMAALGYQQQQQVMASLNQAMDIMNQLFAAMQQALVTLNCTFQQVQYQQQLALQQQQGQYQQPYPASAAAPTAATPTRPAAAAAVPSPMARSPMVPQTTPAVPESATATPQPDKTPGTENSTDWTGAQPAPGW